MTGKECNLLNTRQSSNAATCSKEDFTCRQIPTSLTWGERAETGGKCKNVLLLIGFTWTSWRKFVLALKKTVVFRNAHAAKHVLLFWSKLARKLITHAKTKNDWQNLIFF